MAASSSYAVPSVPHSPTNSLYGNSLSSSREPVRLNDDVLRCIFSFVPSSSKSSQSTAWESLRSSAATCRQWYTPATEALYRDLGDPLCRWDGYHAPMIIKTLKSQGLGYCVRSLHITSTLEAGLWHSDYTTEGDLFADIVAQCPALREVTIASFEESSMPRVIAALKKATMIESFHIRVYIESWRRSSKFNSLVPYANWSYSVINELFAAWPNLKSFSVQHIPCDAYHMLPDPVLAADERSVSCPKEMMPRLERAVLRETLISDAGFRHLFMDHPLTELVVMSCQGVGSGLSVSRKTLLQTIAAAGKTLRKLEIMTPWLDNTTARSRAEPEFLLDEAVKHCENLTQLTVAGFDVSNKIFSNLHPNSRIQHLGITDFELITAHGILHALSFPTLSQLRELAVWQRNDGRRTHGGSSSLGWFEASFVRGDSRLSRYLSKARIAVGTGWESRLISGGAIEFHHALDSAALDLQVAT